jgi:hypothetical protein
MSDSGAKYIMAHAHRLITLATRCAFSFGSCDGLNDLLQTPDDPHGDWRDPVSVLHRDASMMVVMRVSTLLDRNEVSFQAVHRLLKDPDVVAALLQALENQHGPDAYVPSRTDLIDEFRKIYSEVDWKVHSRLMHLRNLGIAHLSVEEMTKSITFTELRTLVKIVSLLAATLQQLCATQNAFRTDISDEYRRMALRTMMRIKP